MKVYIDIETIPSQAPGARDEIAAKIGPPGTYKKADTIAAWERDEKPGLVDEAWRKTALDGTSGHVISVAFAVDDLWRVEGCGPGDLDTPYLSLTPDYASWLGIEAERLRTVFKKMEETVQHAGSLVSLPPGVKLHPMPIQVIAHNADFDVRFLYQRAVILGVPVPSWWPVNERIGSDRLFCTMQAWAGWRERVSLDRLCRALGIETKGELDGAGVYDAWLAGKSREIWAYNKADVRRVREVHKRLVGPPPANVFERLRDRYPRSWDRPDVAA